jgi:hypothetical protein
MALLPFKCSYRQAGCHLKKKTLFKVGIPQEALNCYFNLYILKEVSWLTTVVNKLCNRLSVLLIFIIWREDEKFKTNATSDSRNVQFMYNLIR